VQSDGADSTQVGAYLRLQGTEYVLVVLNNNLTPVTVHVPLQNALTAQGITVKTARLHSLLSVSTGEFPLQDGMLTLRLESLDAILLGE